MSDLRPRVRGVFFDLDGTLLDSAPDLYAALQALCLEEGKLPPPYERVRAVVSRGSLAILRCAFDGEAQVASRVPRFLALYEAVMARETRPFETRPFDGVAELLDEIEASGWRWGIVTNKPGFLTTEVVRRVGWEQRSSATIAGDTLAVKKPDPAPVLLACQRAGVSAQDAIFVGDDVRDIQAGAAAGLVTVAAAWGYLDGGDPHRWGADITLESPAALRQWLAQCRVGA